MSAFMAALPDPNSELKKLPQYSPFLNIVEQAISALKADISRPEQQEPMNNREKARRQGIALGNFRTDLLLHMHPAEKHWHYHGC